MEREVREHYDRVAVEIYDNSIDWQFAATYEDEDEVRESMVDMLDLTPGMRRARRAAASQSDAGRPSKGSPRSA